MGLNANLTAVGPYSKKIGPYLDDYYEEYSNIEEGDIVAVDLFYCDGNENSKKLAEIFGFKCYELNKFHIKKIKPSVYFKLKHHLLSLGQYEEDVAFEIESLRNLINANFIVIYRPHG